LNWLVLPMSEQEKRDTLSLDGAGSGERKRPAVATAVNYQEPMQGKRAADWLLRLFDLFAELSLSTEKELPDLVTKVERPAPLGRDTTDGTKLEGTVSTSSWQLTVRLIGSRIVGYLYPLGGAGHASTDLGENKPLFTFDSKESAGEREWFFEERKIAYAQLPTYARRFFNKLIKVSFTHAEAEGTASDKLGRFDSIDEEKMLSIIDSLSDEDDTPFIAPPEADASAGVSISQTPQQDSQPEEIEMVMTEELTVAGARKQMERAIEKELTSIIDLGKNSFEKQDWDVVNRAMKKAQLLKEYKEKVFAVLSEWDEIEREVGDL